MQVKADIGITILATDLQQKINQLMKKDHEIIELKKQIQQLKDEIAEKEKQISEKENTEEKIEKEVQKIEQTMPEISSISRGVKMINGRGHKVTMIFFTPIFITDDEVSKAFIAKHPEKPYFDPTEWAKNEIMIGKENMIKEDN